MHINKITIDEFDACSKSPNGEHSESWYANNDCDFCGTGATDAPLYYSISELESECGGRCNAEYNPCAARVEADKLKKDTP